MEVGKKLWIFREYVELAKSRGVTDAQVFAVGFIYLFFYAVLLQNVSTN